MHEFQAMLARLRNDFLSELPERCDTLEGLVLSLEKSPNEREVYNELFRGVHSLKGSGGTHGLTLITTICHQMENMMTDSDNKQLQDRHQTSRLLTCLDLLRQTGKEALRETPDFSSLERKLEQIRVSSAGNRKTCLIVESSDMMVQLYQMALSGLPVQLVVEAGGLAALSRLLSEHFDFLIASRETKDLNGVALLSALRASGVRSHALPAILVSSKVDAVSQRAGFTALIERNKELPENLARVVKAILAEV